MAAADALPPALAFLMEAGRPFASLAKAADLARTQGVEPEAALLALGEEEETYYRALAAHLGAEFLDADAEPALTASCYPRCIHAGVVPLAAKAPAGGPVWLVAPRGTMLKSLLRRKAAGETLRGRIVVAAPTHFSQLARAQAAPDIVRAASLSLLARGAHLSAMDGASEAQCCAAIGALAFAILACVLSPPIREAFAIASSLVFLAATSLRLFAGASSGSPRWRAAAPVDDARLPAYSIIVALRKEARVVRDLCAALEALDYPRGKLDIKLVLEEDDIETRLALERLRLPPTYEIVIAPPGLPRTKPRALNIALSLAAGQYVAVFDAEDAPAPRQLRDAAERFLRAPRRTACLQAALAIDNVEDSWLTRLFSIEYAALFDVTTHGLASLRLPIALGGTSNHFRVDVLREIGGWDAWNVTEDADLGLRLARFGYRVETLVSTTQEEAPARLRTWIAQRRRWAKGWMQTFITLSRDPGRLL